MRQEIDGCPIRGGKGSRGIELSFSLQELENLPDAKGYRGYKFSKLQDDALLKFWNKKNKQELSTALGMCVNTARARYRELIKGRE